jgi:hypothetical protein
MDKETANVFKVCRLIACLVLFMGIVFGNDGIAVAVGIPLISGGIAGAYLMHKAGLKIQS